MSEPKSNTTDLKVIQDLKKAAFKAGYERAKLDAIDRCLMEKLPKSEPEWRPYNAALGFAKDAIRALDVRHALPLEDASSV